MGYVHSRASNSVHASSQHPDVGPSLTTLPFSSILRMIAVTCQINASNFSRKKAQFKIWGTNP